MGTGIRLASLNTITSVGQENTMTYTLKKCLGEGNQQSQQNPTPTMINQAIDRLIPVKFYHVILDADPAIGDCIYIQTRILEGGPKRGWYLIEARYVINGKTSHYKTYSPMSGEVKRLFGEFEKGKAPNTAGWIDISGQFASEDDFSKEMQEFERKIKNGATAKDFGLTEEEFENLKRAGDNLGQQTE